MSESTQHREPRGDRSPAKSPSANLDVARQALEALRTGKLESLFDLWDTIEQQIGRAQTSEIQQQLVQIRNQFVEEATSLEAERLKKSFEQSATAGWQAWLTVFTASVTEFRMTFAQRLCEFHLPFSESDRRILEKLRKSAACMAQSRWPEAYDQLEYLSQQDFLPALTRARLQMMLGQIQLFHFRKL